MLGMKSKIPHPKTSRSDKQSQPAPGAERPNTHSVQEALNLLGIPHIEAEEFNRLYHGPLTNILLFVSEHIKGRQEAALARNRIYQ
jgi:hypothetical protein